MWRASLGRHCGALGGVTVSDLFFGQLSDIWNQLFSLHPVRVFFPHLAILVHQTWPIALIGWFGVRLMVRSTGRVLHLGGDILLFGTVWSSTMLMYSRLGLEGSAIVHALFFSLLVLGCVARFVSTAVSGSRNRRYGRS